LQNKLHLTALRLCLSGIYLFFENFIYRDKGYLLLSFSYDNQRIKYQDFFRLKLRDYIYLARSLRDSFFYFKALYLRHVLVKLFSKLPNWWVYIIAEGTAFFLFYVFRYRRSVVRKNLLNSFPEKDIKEIRQIEKKFYQNFPKVFFESIYSYGFSKHAWEAYIEIKNPEILSTYLDNGTPVILLNGHMANWEWAGLSVGMLIDYPIEFMYKPVRNERSNQFILNLRERDGATAIPKDDAVRHILKRRKVPRIIYMVADQLPAIGIDRLWFNFLNQETIFIQVQNVLQQWWAMLFFIWIAKE